MGVSVCGGLSSNVRANVHVFDIKSCCHNILIIWDGPHILYQIQNLVHSFDNEPISEKKGKKIVHTHARIFTNTCLQHDIRVCSPKAITFFMELGAIISLLFFCFSHFIFVSFFAVVWYVWVFYCIVIVTQLSHSYFKVIWFYLVEYVPLFIESIQSILALTYHCVSPSYCAQLHTHPIFIILHLYFFFVLHFLFAIVSMRGLFKRPNYYYYYRNNQHNYYDK